MSEQLHVKAKKRALEEEPSRNNKSHTESLHAVSLVVSVRQALQSDDSELIDTLLNQRDRAVVLATCRDLSARDAVKLLVEVLSRLEKCPAKAGFVTEWARCLITCHAASIASSADVRALIEPVYAGLKQRQETHSKLMSLQGKVVAVLAMAATSSRDAPNVVSSKTNPFKKSAETSNKEPVLKWVLNSLLLSFLLQVQGG